jgi:hypothetical protein
MIPTATATPFESAFALVGTWRIVSYEARDSKGQVQYPLGEHVLGQLVYDTGDNMSAHLMRQDRLVFVSNDPARGTDAEVRAAFESHVSYFGTYTIDPATQTVTHRVRGASYPNWTGHDQIRYYKFEGDHLHLSTPPLVIGGESFEYVLIWERIG